MAIRSVHHLLFGIGITGVLLAAGCDGAKKPETAAAPSTARPSILLVTLDTTRADSIGPEAAGVATPGFNALAARGLRFRQAYATVPETLPSHTSIMTGLYPAGHTVHENARNLPASHPVLAEQLHQAGYRTAAFVSSFVLARRFGLARGFEVYDDQLPAGRNERSARETTEAALAELRQPSQQPRFLWVHYYDPHFPYTPPEPFKSKYAGKPYLGEVAAMDEQLGRLVQAFEQQAKAPIAIVVAADHGEGLGDHGEAQHGNLLYQSTMRVPLVIAGPGVSAGVSDVPVSTRRIYHTVLDWAGLAPADSLRSASGASAPEVVLGEAMKPFLEYGWQPQVMSVAGKYKAILAGKLESYDVAADPAELRNLGAGANLPASLRSALDDYPVPSPEAARAADNLDEDARRRLASLGYVGATAAPLVRKDAPRPADMIPLFEDLDKASGLFASGQYGRAIPLLESIIAKDPYNLDATLRLASAHSALGHDAQAVKAFGRAAEIAPKSPDVRTYLALHYARGREWERAVPLLEGVIADTPERLPALEALAVLRERQGQVDQAIELRRKIYGLRRPSAGELVQMGRLAMRAGQTPLAIDSLENARALQGDSFRQELELGVLYLAARRFQDAREALDRVPSSDPAYPMALFKRAQVSVLLHEPDQAERIRAARQHADATTRPLIANERLFQ